MDALLISCAALIIVLIVAFIVRRSYRENKEIESCISRSNSLLGLKPYKVASTDEVKKLVELIPARALKQGILEHIEVHGLLNVEHSFLIDLSDTDSVKEWGKGKKKSNAYFHKQTNRIVEAIQWKCTKKAHGEMAGWEDRRFAEWECSEGPTLRLHTHQGKGDGILTVERGDWAIRLVLPGGEAIYSVLEPDVFNQEYKPVEDGEGE